jgi:hypothetical protein
VTRSASERALDESLRPIAQFLDEAFSLIDETIGRLDESVEGPYGRVCALVLIKGKNLALGLYTLMLDALAQEAGAIFRPFIEAVELLTYLRLDPTRIIPIVEKGKFPKAGKVAKQIGGQLKPLRDYLSEHASHLAMSEEAMLHLVNLKEGQLKSFQPFVEEVLRENLRLLLAAVLWLMAAGVNAVSAGGGAITEDFVDRAEDLRTRILPVLRPKALPEPPAPGPTATAS